VEPTGKSCHGQGEMEIYGGKTLLPWEFKGLSHEYTDAL